MLYKDRSCILMKSTILINSLFTTDTQVIEYECANNCKHLQTSENTCKQLQEHAAAYRNFCTSSFYDFYDRLIFVDTKQIGCKFS